MSTNPESITISYSHWSTSYSHWSTNPPIGRQIKALVDQSILLQKHGFWANPLMKSLFELSLNSLWIGPPMKWLVDQSFTGLLIERPMELLVLQSLYIVINYFYTYHSKSTTYWFNHHHKKYIFYLRILWELRL